MVGVDTSRFAPHFYFGNPKKTPPEIHLPRWATCGILVLLGERNPKLMIKEF